MIYNTPSNFIKEDGTLDIQSVTRYVIDEYEADPSRQQIRLPIDSTSLAILRKSLGVVNNTTPQGGVILPTSSLVNGIVSGYVKSDNYVTGSTGWSIKGDGSAEFSNVTVRGYVAATSGTIGGFTINTTSLSAGSTTSRITLDTSSGIYLGADIFDFAPFKVSLSGVLTAIEANITGTITATSGRIGGFTIGTNELYGGIIKTAENVGEGTSGVIIDSNGLRGYDSVLGEVFSLPTDGSAPRFSSGIISNTIFNVNTNAVIRTSETVGDGTSSSAGILINDTGFYGCSANQTLENADIKILINGTAVFNASIRGGQTDYATGTGYFLGLSDSDYKFSIGSDMNYMRWDGEFLKIKGSFDVGDNSVINNSVYTYANLPISATSIGFNNPSAYE